jgi:hypothetical protein
MLLGNEISNLFSRLFSSSEIKSHEASKPHAARNEYHEPLMQIVERRLSQRREEAGALASHRGFANEVGPPPLTPANFGR